MGHNIFITFLLTIVLLTGCKTNKSSLSNKAGKSNQEMILLAWNEDTIHSYLFAVTEDNKFYYTIINKDSLEVKEYYHGTLSKRSSSDTLFLEYSKNRRPYGAKNYLVREVSGNYLIQPFDSSSKRIFLRRQKSDHWF